MRSALRLALAMFVILAGTTVQADDPPNVLFISVDDMRPEIGCYGNTEIITPNFDAFSKRARPFSNRIAKPPSVLRPERA